MAAEHQLAFVIAATLAGSFASSFGKADKVIVNAQKQLNLLSKAAGNVENYQKMQQRITTNQAVIVGMKKEARSLASRIQNIPEFMRGMPSISADIEKTSKEMNDLTSRTDSLQKKLDKDREVLGRLRSELVSAGVDTKNLSSEQASLQAQVEKLTQAQTRLSDAQGRIDSAKQRLKNATGEIIESAGVLMLLGETTQAAMRFESAMADVKKVVNFDTGKEQEQLKELENGFLALSRRIPMADTEITKIGTSAGQAGIARPEILQFTEDAAKMTNRS